MSYESSDDVQPLLDQFEEAFDETREERILAEQCRDYYDGIQWTQDEIHALSLRKQPVITKNRIRPKIDSLLGFEKRQRTDPKAYPRTQQHDEDAEAATDAIRFVCEENRFDMIRSAVAEDMAVEGIGGCTVTIVENDKGQFDVKFKHVPWDRIYRDPHSRENDFSDANFMGVVLWMDESDALTQFPGKDEVIQGAYTSSDHGSETYDDRPRIVWSDRKRKRIRVLQHRCKKDGKWYTSILCRGGFLRPEQLSPYLDEKGEPACDLLLQSAYVDRQNRRYGAVKDMISPQDEINKRTSKALHRLSVNRVIAERGAVDNVSQARAEMARADGYVEVNPGMRFDVASGDGAMIGELELLREAKSEIDASGVNPSLQGDLQAPSGRAVEALQIAGLSQHAKLFDALREWSWRVYRASWNRIRQYWTDERWIRVTDDEKNLRWVGINHPITRGEQILRAAEAVGQEIPPDQLFALQNDPAMQEVVQIEHPIAELDVDIIVEDGPDTVTIQSEQFDALIQLKQADPQAIPIEMVIEASNLRNKERILEHLQQGGIPPQVQQQMQEMEKVAKETAEKLQEAESQLQDRQVDTQRIQVDQFRAETDRIKAETDRMKAQSELMKLQAEMAAMGYQPQV